MLSPFGHCFLKWGASTVALLSLACSALLPGDPGPHALYEFVNEAGKPVVLRYIYLDATQPTPQRADVSIRSSESKRVPIPQRNARRTDGGMTLRIEARAEAGELVSCQILVAKEFRSGPSEPTVVAVRREINCENKSE